MINTAKAYIGTEGTVNYRGCDIRYYTYTMSDQPTKFKIIVNVELHYTQNVFVKTLSLDEAFDKEDAAVNYGVEHGKQFIDRAYEKGKIDIVKTNNPIKPKSNRPVKAKEEKGRR